MSQTQEQKKEQKEEQKKEQKAQELDASKRSRKTYHYGLTGFVELSGDNARKYSLFDSMFWVREHQVMLELWPYYTQNVIQFKSNHIARADAPPRFDQRDWYFITNYPRYVGSLHGKKIFHTEQICQIMLDLMSALEFIHGIGVIHRDIKPANVLLDSNNRAILADFSHAYKMRKFPADPKDVDGLLKERIKIHMDRRVGTYVYRAPEEHEYYHLKGYYHGVSQPGQAPYGPSVDMWACGMLLFSLISQCPFDKFYEELLGLEESNELPLFDLYYNKAQQFPELLDQCWAKHRRDLHLSDTLYSWVKLMVQVDPDRVKPAAMQRLIWSTGMENNLDLIRPVNALDSARIAPVRPLQLKDLPLTPEQHLIYEKVINAVDLLALELPMRLSIPRIDLLIRHLIIKGTIRADNLVVRAHALAHIMNCSVFDDVTDLLVDGPYDLEQLRHAVMYIMCEHAHEIFGPKSLFTFEYSSECPAQPSDDNIDSEPDEVVLVNNMNPNVFNPNVSDDAEDEDDCSETSSDSPSDDSYDGQYQADLKSVIRGDSSEKIQLDQEA